MYGSIVVITSIHHVVIHWLVTAHDEANKIFEVVRSSVTSLLRGVMTLSGDVISSTCMSPQSMTSIIKPLFCLYFLASCAPMMHKHIHVHARR